MNAKPVFDAARLLTLATSYENEPPASILQRAFAEAPNLTFACSFGAEDMVLLDMIMKIRPETPVFYLDTDVLFSETYALIEQVKMTYQPKHLFQIRPALTLEEQAEQYGPELWKQTPDRCCDIRKVQPLTRVLHNYDAWITGIRRDQAPTRKHAQAFEWDAKFQLLKVNPLIRWTLEDVWGYLREHNVPYNPLHDQGYPSIGCFHCTRPVQAGEDPRAGRWSGFTKTECGLHR